MSRADNPYDNAFMESCFSRFKVELLQGGAFQNREDAQSETFEFIEMYYNLQKEPAVIQTAGSFLDIPVLPFAI